MEEKEFNLVDWFDPHNVYHMESYIHLEKTGSWPEGFLPKGILIPYSWQFLVLNKIANCWIDLYEGKGK